MQNNIQEKGSLSQYLFSSNGELQFKVPKEGLPEFFLKVAGYVNTGHVKEATELLRDQADEVIEQCVKNEPSKKALMYLLLALMFQRTGLLRMADKWYKKTLELESHALVLNELANICQLTKRLTEAMECRRRALELAPDDVGILNNFALDLMRIGRVEEGVEMLRKVLEKSPASKLVRSCYIWHLHYLPDMDSQKTFVEHKKWGQMHAPMSMAKTSHDNLAEPDRKLRVGYLSADFRMHSVAYNFDAFLGGRNKNAVEVYGYGNVKRPDEFTEHFKKSFDCYRNICGIADEEAAKIIEKDKIDILVHVGGHTADNSLGVLAYKPAPIQVDYGGINTTGMEQVDYRLTDELLDPPHLRKYYLEEPVDLATGLFCYKPSPFASPIGPLPAREKGYVTFGSFNVSIKINPYIMSLWAEVLKANEKSHLMLKFAGASDEGIKDYYVSQFEQLGVERERLEFYDWLEPAEHLKLYGQMDIALDTYPFNGCMTTLEGMWMGVPIVSLVGDNSLLSRSGLSILSRVGLEFFAAKSGDEFVKKASAFAQNLDALEKIRVSMRQRMTSGTLCNPKAYAQSVEDAYRKMWRKWCGAQGVDVEEETAGELSLTEAEK